MAKGRRLCSVPLVVSLGALLGLGIVVTLTSIHHQRLREDHGGGTRFVSTFSDDRVPLCRLKPRPHPPTPTPTMAADGRHALDASER